MAIHVVKPGESLWTISRMQGVSIGAIAQVNGLQTVNALVPGLALYIPKDTLPTRYYQIAPGDTLGALAVRFNTTVQNILAANPGIKPNSLTVGQRIIIPSPNKLTIRTLGFIVPYSPASFLSTLPQIASQLSYIAIVSYSFTEQGYAYLEINDSEVIANSRQLKIAPLLTIRNFKEEFSAELVGRVLENSIYRRNLIQSIMDFVTQKGYGGVSIDFEFIPPPRRMDFVSFLRELKNALGRLVLQVNVHAKTEDIPTNRIIGAYDYKAIGEVADIVAVMTIDYGYPTGPPNPISPVWWVERVIQYALSQIRRDKLQIALPLYGYDWTLPSYSTRALSVLAAQNLAISTGSNILFDSYARAPWYRYWTGGTEHVVWFEDIRSYIEKYKLIDVYRILGTTFWQLSLPAPQNWEFMKRNLSVMK